MMTEVRTAAGTRTGRPRDFIVDEDLYEIAEVEDRWYEPEAMYFRVRTTEGKRFILRALCGYCDTRLFLWSTGTDVDTGRRKTTKVLLRDRNSGTIAIINCDWM